MKLITQTKELAAFCSRLSTHTYVTVDTEFLRETTYYPKLCLIQIASPAHNGVEEEVQLIDALSPQLDLKPFYDLMVNEKVIKVFHSARQDIEIIWNGAKIIPTPLFDTQVAAMVCGFGDQISYESLATNLANAKIDKSSRFTDWSRRPLSNAQIEYAASDVTHLRVVYEKLAEKLEKTGRTDWLHDEMAVLTSTSTYDAHPEHAWERVKTRIRKPRDLAILIEIAAWREREAQTKDVPRGRILKDDAIGEIVSAAPTSLEDLARLRGLSNGFERSKSGADVIAAVQRGIERNIETLPAMKPERSSSNSNGALIQLLKVLLQATAEHERVAPKIIATSDDLDAIASGDETQTPALQGWRLDIFGLKALALKRGEVALTVKRGRIVTIALDEEEAV
jgi:ribonuclease D